MYNYNHLYYFYVTAKAGGVTSASNHLRISQPSLSSQLKVLEQSLDMKLFQKAGRSIELTHSGAEVFGFCRQMFEYSEKMTEMISKKHPSATRKLTIGVSEQIDRNFVADVVANFLKKYEIDKRPKVSVVSVSQGQLIDKLRFKEFDAVLSDTTLTDSSFHDLMKQEVPVVLTCSNQLAIKADSDTFNSSEVVRSISNNNAIQWILPSPKFKFRTDIDKFLESHGVKTKIAFESDFMSSLVHATSDEIGMGFFPIIFVNQSLKENDLKLIGPKDGFWKYQLNLTCHEQNKDDRLVINFADSFKDLCELREF
jgi:LysR family transcriptional activator of nhaA